MYMNIYVYICMCVSSTCSLNHNTAVIEGIFFMRLMVSIQSGDHLNLDWAKHVLRKPIWMTHTETQCLPDV